jgi:hypothetical protein
MTDYLYFRKSIEKMKGGQRLFAVLRLREGLAWEFKALEKKGPYDILLVKHVLIQHLYWDEFWWRRLREYRRSILFKTVRKYI